MILTRLFIKHTYYTKAFFHCFTLWTGMCLNESMRKYTECLSHTQCSVLFSGKEESQGQKHCLAVVITSFHIWTDHFTSHNFLD